MYYMLCYSSLLLHPCLLAVVLANRVNELFFVRLHNQIVLCLPLQLGISDRCLREPAIEAAAAAACRATGRLPQINIIGLAVAFSPFSSLSFTFQNR